MKNLIKYELLNTFREMNTSIVLSVILITASLVSLLYILGITYFPSDALYTVIKFMFSVMTVFFMGTMFITQLYYYPKKNGIYLTYIALGHSLYKLWLMKSLILFIFLYGIFFISFIFSVLIAAVLGFFGVFKNIVLFNSYLEILLFLISGPILGVAFSAFLEGMIFMLVKEMGSAIILPNIISIAAIVSTVYLLPKFIDINIITENILYVLIIISLGIPVLFVIFPYYIFKLKKVENFIR
ncbi:MAG: hypothetical protein ACP5FK_00845 [bacterium]